MAVTGNRGRVAVVGAAGHVGLPLTLVLTNAGFDVTGIDLAEARLAAIRGGTMPFYEDQGLEQLDQALRSGRLHLTTEISGAAGAETVIIVPGTPIDEHLNPRLDSLIQLVRSLAPHLSETKLLVLRSTVAPGTTAKIKDILETETMKRCGVDFALAFAPERVLQGKAIHEIKALPQLIGVFDDYSYGVAEAFFASYLQAPCIRLTPVEAEIGKLVTNMARYVRFAFANEVHMIAETWGANANKVIDAVNNGYPRADIARPGPNVGGPCLYKDGYFLTERIPFTELIGTAFKINEGMPAHVVARLERQLSAGSVAILGMTFKANSDDNRNSLSYKLKKQLIASQYDVRCFDPHLEECRDESVLKGVDAIVLMTPHDEFSSLKDMARLVGNADCIVCDVWGFWPEARHTSQNGFFRLSDVL
jgi:UDP-N-acetyl-D-mannosaminuronic acid dehydrogenase